VKKFAASACIVAVLLCVLYLSILLLIDAVSGKAMQFLRTEAGGHGVEITNIGYDDSLFVLPARIQWSGVAATVKIGGQSQFLPNEEVKINVEEVRLGPQGLGESSYRLQLKGITVSLTGEDDGQALPSSNKQYLVKGKKAELTFPMKLLPPDELLPQARAVADSLLDLFRFGKSSLPIRFSGMASLPLDNEVFHARVTVGRDGGASILRMDEEDVILISQRIGLERGLTNEEVRLIALNPLKAKQLFRIRTYARRESREAHGKDRAVPKDAYRHILWSYLLTKTFGAKFATQVTDAHESGRTGNTRDERLMDLHNNLVGARYADGGRGEEEILSLVMNDPDVVRRPADVRR